MMWLIMFCIIAGYIIYRIDKFMEGKTLSIIKLEEADKDDI